MTIGKNKSQGHHSKGRGHMIMGQKESLGLRKTVHRYEQNIFTNKITTNIINCLKHNAKIINSRSHEGQNHNFVTLEWSI